MQGATATDERNIAEGELPRFFGSKYEILEKIADGGMAQVYLARPNNTSLDRRVAIKALRPELADQAHVEMFLQEAKVGARLTHPNIVETYDLGCVNGVHFIAMEYVEGRTLNQIIRQLLQGGQTAPYGIIVKIMAQVARALHHAHNAADPDGQPLNVVHRDVTPANILVSFAGDVKVADFGLAKVTGARHQTAAGYVKGKVAYLSPEQILGQPIDRRSDLFAFGVTLFEATTLRRLFARDDNARTLDAILHEPIPPPSHLVADYPKALEGIVLHCLERAPAHRYQDARRLRQDLEKFLADNGIDHGTIAISKALRDFFARSELGNLPRLETIPEETSHSALSHSEMAMRRSLYDIQQQRHTPRRPTVTRQELVLLAVALGLLTAVLWLIVHLVVR